MIIEFLYKPLETWLSLFLFINLFNVRTIWIMLAKLIQRFSKCHKKGHTWIFYCNFLLLAIKWGICELVLSYFRKLEENLSNDINLINLTVQVNKKLDHGSPKLKYTTQWFEYEKKLSEVWLLIFKNFEDILFNEKFDFAEALTGPPFGERSNHKI